MVKTIKIAALSFALFFLSITLAAGEWPLVVIDPAHGGKDYGVAVTEKVKEKDITLKIALLLKKELEKTGRLRVVLTRETDVDLPTADRIKRIKGLNPAAVLSLHVNRAFGRSARGFEIYFPGFKPTERKEKKSGEAQHIIQSMRRTEYLNKSVLLAQKLQQSLVQVFPKENRGLREAPMELTESLTVPAVVVELGFASNTENLKKITTPKYEEEMARALSRGILESIGKR